MELPLLARPHVAAGGRKERQTQRSGAEENHKRGEEEGRRRDTGMEQ